MNKVRAPASPKQRRRSRTKIGPASGFDLLAPVFAVIAPQESANDGPDLLGRWGAGTEIGTALFWDRASPVYHDPRQAHFTVALLLRLKAATIGCPIVFFKPVKARF